MSTNINDSVYDSLISMYETLMLQLVRKLRENEVDWKKDYDKLLEVFTNTANDSRRMSTMLAQLRCDHTYVPWAGGDEELTGGPPMQVCTKCDHVVVQPGQQ